MLRPIVADDAPAMIADLDDEEANRLTGTTDLPSADDVVTWCATRADATDRLDLAVTERATGRWCGEVVANELDRGAASCGIRIALSAHARDRGMGTEALRLLLDHLMDGVDDPVLERVELEVLAINPRAIAVYERLGFDRTGVRPGAVTWHDETIDAIDMVLTRGEHRRRS